MISVLYFNSSWSPYHWVGTALGKKIQNNSTFLKKNYLVFGGTLLYTELIFPSGSSTKKKAE
jgi:hypothetical protein